VGASETACQASEISKGRISNVSIVVNECIYNGLAGVTIANDSCLLIQANLSLHGV
jgi:hypothetical protein